MHTNIIMSLVSCVVITRFSMYVCMYVCMCVCVYVICMCIYIWPSTYCACVRVSRGVYSVRVHGSNSRDTHVVVDGTNWAGNVICYFRAGTFL